MADNKKPGRRHHVDTIRDFEKLEMLNETVQERIDVMEGLERKGIIRDFRVISVSVFNTVIGVHKPGIGFTDEYRWHAVLTTHFIENEVKEDE